MKRYLAFLLLLIPLSLPAQTNSAAGNLTAASASCLATNCVSLRFYPNTIYSTITLSGTWSATVQFEVSGDFGTTWVAASTASSTSNGTTQFTIGGFTSIRARVSSFVSGTVVVTIIGSTQTAGSVSSTGITSTQIAPNMNPWYASPNCGTQTNCTTIHADGHLVRDATSNSTTTVTAPDGNFTGTDAFGRPVAVVGETVWATTAGPAGFGQFIFTTVVCPQTTIASINSATSITLNAACTASGSANVQLIWGHKDGAALHTAGLTVEAIGSNQCASCNGASLHLPSGIILDEQPFLTGAIANPTQLVGDGGSEVTTIVVITPDFAWASCTGPGATGGGICIGSSASYIGSINFFGSGLTSAANANCANGSGKVVVAGNSSATQLIGVNVSGICPGETGEGVELNAVDENFDYGGAQDSMTNACVVSGKAIQFRSADCHNLQVSGGVGTVVNTGAQLQDLATFLHGGISIAGTGQVSSYGSHFVSPLGGTSAAVSCNGAGAVWNSNGDWVGVDAVSVLGLVIGASGCNVTTRNTVYTATGNAITENGIGITDGGGNTVTSGTVAITVARGAQVIAGLCTGTATSSATLVLFGAGQSSASTCTVTTPATPLGVPLLQNTGTLIGLGVNATHAGVNASSGVITVMKNGVATALTCTIGTGTSCTDSTHTVSYTYGDIISIQFTTQATEVLAGVKAVVLAW